MDNLPILDTEEKLRSYIRKEWRGNYEPHHVTAIVLNADSVLIKKSKEADMQAVHAHSFGRGTIVVYSERIVDPCVLPVLEEAYRKYDAECEQKHQEYLQTKARIEDRWGKEHRKKMASKANMTPDRFMEGKRGLEKKLKHPSLLTRIFNLFK